MSVASGKYGRKEAPMSQSEFGVREIESGLRDIRAAERQVTRVAGPRTRRNKVSHGRYFWGAR